MLNLITDTFNRLLYRIPKRPRQVQLEVTNRCNLDCPMCPREVMDIELEHMEWDTFQAVVDKLNHQEDITLTGWGEPFLHPRIFDMIDYCKEHGHAVKITSNGLFPPGVSNEKIANSGLDHLTFSIDSVEGGIENGHVSHKALKSIEAMPKLRKNGTPSLRLQATLHADGGEALYDVIRFGAKLGYDCVNVGRVDRKYDKDLKRPGLAEEERIFQKADRLAKQSGIQLDWLQYGVGRGIMRWGYRLLRKKLHRSGSYCLKTFDYTYITREGNVTPCCLLPERPIGNAASGDLESLWQSDDYNDFRENYRDVCGKCDLWTVDMVDNPQEEASVPDKKPIPATTPV